MSAYFLRIDAKHFYPGTWGRLMPENQAKRQAQLRAIQDRRRGNAGVTPEQQDFLQSIPAEGNRRNTGTEKTARNEKTRVDIRQQ